MSYRNNQLNIAVTRFVGFVSDLPLSPNQDDVSEYHSIVELFEEGCGLDLSEFRIAAGRLTPAESRTAPTSGCGWQTRYLRKPTVDFGYFRSQVRALIEYLVTVLDRPN
jgi:hypothetical protein